MIKAALIDLDGLLINSEELYLAANKLYFEKFGIEFTEDLHRQGTGRKFVDWIKTVTDIDKSGEELQKERNAIFYEIVKKKLHLLPGAKEFLVLAHNNFKTSLVTSSTKDFVGLVFNMTGIRSYFDLLVTVELITLGKPDPEPYLLAAGRLNVEPEECAVFEDAPSGVLAGKNAGMRVIAIPSHFVKGDKVFEKADLILGSLEEITLQNIKN